MLLDIVTKGAVDRSVELSIIDSGDGTPETGVVFNTSGIDLWYARELSAVVSVTEATLASLTTAHADGGFLHKANGRYRFDLPDAAFATGANHVDIGGTVTGMVVIGGRVRLVDVNLEVANIPANVTQWLGTAAATPTVNGVPEVDLTHVAGSTTSVSALASGVATLLADWLNGGRLDLILDIIAADTTTDIPALIAALNNLSAAQVNAEADTALADYDPPTRTEATADKAEVLARLSPIATKTGTVVTDGGNSATSFKTDLTETPTDHFKDAFLRLTSGALINQVKKVTAYNGTTKVITVSGGFTATPADGVTFEIVND